MADISANGQNYANANGHCVSLTTLSITLAPGTTIPDIGEFTSITIRDAGTNSIVFSGYVSQWSFPYSTTLPASSNGYYTVRIVPESGLPIEVTVNNVMKDLYTTQTWSGVSGNTILINISALF